MVNPKMKISPKIGFINAHFYLYSIAYVKNCSFSPKNCRRPAESFIADASDVVSRQQKQDKSTLKDRLRS